MMSWHPLWCTFCILWKTQITPFHQREDLTFSFWPGLAPVLYLCKCLTHWMTITSGCVRISRLNLENHVGGKVLWINASLESKERTQCDNTIYVIVTLVYSVHYSFDVLICLWTNLWGAQVTRHACNYTEMKGTINKEASCVSTWCNSHGRMCPQNS